MKGYKIASLAGIMMGAMALTGCLTTGTTSSQSTTTTGKPFKLDDFGTTTATFVEGGTYQQGSFFYTEHVPYSFRSPSTKYFTYPSILYSNYMTPDGYPNALLLDDTDEAMFAVESGASNKKIATTESLVLNRPKQVTATIEKIAADPRFKVELSGVTTGYVNNVVRGGKQPFERVRYLAMTNGEPTTVSELRDEMIKHFYKTDYARTTSGIQSDFNQRFFYIDVVTWSDAKDKSKFYTTYLIHGMPKLSETEEAQWASSRQHYLTAFNMMQF